MSFYTKFTKIIFVSVLAILFIKQVIANENPEQIIENIKPVGQVNIAGETPAQTQTTTTPLPAVSLSAVTTADKGATIYQTYCSACHNTGAAGAPKLGDKSAWQPRIAQGETVLVQHAINGYKIMPPKGTCMSCTDADITAAVNYMVSKVK